MAARAPRALQALTLLASLCGLLSTARAAREQDLTYDEPTHMQWSRRLVDERVTERRTNPMWNSKTPVIIPNVLAKDAGRGLGYWGPAALTFWARLPGLAWYAALLVAVFLLARRLAGSTAAHLATACVALDPNLVAHAAVATVDVPYTLATLLALAAAVAYAEQPSLPRAGLVGLMLGAAFASKFTAFLLLPGLALVPLVYRFVHRDGRDGRDTAPVFQRAPRALVGDVLAVTLVAVAAVDAAYLFVQVGARLDALTWKSGVMQGLAGALPWLRLPVPADFLTGFDISLAHERGRAWSVLIFGRAFPDGVWWYFAASWLLKTPLALLAAQAAGFFLLLRSGRLRTAPGLVALLLNLGLHLFYFSFLFRAQIGYRYVLMGVPLLALLAAAGWAARPPGRALAWGAWLVAALSAAEAVPYLGNTLAFTNVLVTPKERAFRYVANSNIDWGQNDGKIVPWLAAQNFERLHFEPTHIRPGVVVLGLNSLAGGGRYSQHRWLREHAEPEGHFRHTYLWFTVDAAAYERFLEEDRRLTPGPADDELCGETFTRGPFDADEAVSILAREEEGEGYPAWIVCVSAERRADVGFLVTAGGPAWGHASWLSREWDRLRAGEEAWFRLEPGAHALAAARLSGFVGRFEIRGGPATFRLRPARLRRGHPLEPL